MTSKDPNLVRIHRQMGAFWAVLEDPSRVWLLKDDLPFKWTSVRTVVLKASRERVKRHVLLVGDRHVGINLFMGGRIMESDIGRTLVVDLRSDGQPVDTFVHNETLESFGVLQERASQ